VTLDELVAGEAFADATFVGLDLGGFDFADKDFHRCRFRQVNLQESRWAGARLEDCVFEDCDLTRMLPGGVRAHGVSFKGCKLMGVEWNKATASLQLGFDGCNLRYASFVDLNLRATAFVRCVATEANFIDVDLSGADFTGSDLGGTTFRGATLARADLSTATGVFLDPAKNRVKDVRVGVEATVMLAAFFGMKVAGYHEPAEDDVAEKPRRKRR
jgi:fluoroquinolone resistance protein